METVAHNNVKGSYLVNVHKSETVHFDCSVNLPFKRSVSAQTFNPRAELDYTPG